MVRTSTESCGAPASRWCWTDVAETTDEALLMPAPAASVTVDHRPAGDGALTTHHPGAGGAVVETSCVPGGCSSELAPRAWEANDVTVLVTGAAGFIGSTLVEALLASGEHVVAVDCFTPYYEEAVKRSNLAVACASPSFELVHADLRTCDVRDLLNGVDTVYHQAGQPGVRLSWSAGFGEYLSCNVLATQRLLEAALDARVGRFVYASSSSVYGEASQYPVDEGMVPHPTPTSTG